MPQDMRDIIVIGASSGGVEALRELTRALPEDFGGAICVVVHIAPDVRSLLPGILARSGPLRSVHAEDGMKVERGRIHVAPPDHHLLIERGGTLSVTKGPRENRHRPAIDPLFRSAAWAYGPRVVGVVLTGNLDDGTAGLWAIKSCGGTTIVQEPADAAYPAMPSSALMHNRIDHRLTLDEIAATLVELSRTPVGAAVAPPVSLEREIAFERFDADADDLSRLGELSPFTCPACRGALWQMEEGGHLRYRCHVGHSYTQASLDEEHDEAIESSLYLALRAVEEKSMSIKRLSERFPAGIASIRESYKSRIKELDECADQLRDLLAGRPPRTPSLVDQASDRT
jgi:two-component system, chemotaxis family, protein-glutamate methylesterase/glutaminase